MVSGCASCWGTYLNVLAGTSHVGRALKGSLWPHLKQCKLRCAAGLLCWAHKLHSNEGHWQGYADSKAHKLHCCEGRQPWHASQGLKLGCTGEESHAKRAQLCWLS